MNSFLAVPFLATSLFAAGVLVSRMIRTVNGAPRTGCPYCGYGGRPTETRPCSECGRLLPNAIRTWWIRLVIEVGLALLFGSGALLATMITFEGITAVPSPVLMRLADPLGDPGSFGAQANLELQNRVVRGELATEELEPIFIGGVDAAIASNQLFVSRDAWPIHEPVRVALDRTTLNELRTGLKLEFVLRAASSGEERIATTWGGISRTYARPGEAWTWRDPTIVLPDAMRDGDTVRFDAVLRRRDGTEVYRREVTLPVARATTASDLLGSVDDEACLERLAKAMRFRFSPVPREGKPNACAIAWIEPPVGGPLDLGDLTPATGRAIALLITIEQLDEPHLVLEERVVVRDEGGLITPTQTAPLSFEPPPDRPNVPERLGRCRIRIAGDASAALRALRHTRHLSGAIEFEMDLSQAAP